MQGSCANGRLLLGAKCRLIIDFFVFNYYYFCEHMISYSLTSPILTCPFCALNSKVGKNFLYFLKYAQVFSYVALSFQQVLVGYLWSHLFSGEGKQKMNLLAVLLPLICGK